MVDRVKLNLTLEVIWGQFRPSELFYLMCPVTLACVMQCQSSKTHLCLGGPRKGLEPVEGQKFVFPLQKGIFWFPRKSGGSHQLLGFCKVVRLALAYNFAKTQNGLRGLVFKREAFFHLFPAVQLTPSFSTQSRQLFFSSHTHFFGKTMPRFKHFTHPHTHSLLN